MTTDLQHGHVDDEDLVALLRTTMPDVPPPSDETRDRARTLLTKSARQRTAGRRARSLAIGLTAAATAALVGLVVSTDPPVTVRTADRTTTSAGEARAMSPFPTYPYEISWRSTSAPTDSAGARDIRCTAFVFSPGRSAARCDAISGAVVDTDGLAAVGWSAFTVAFDQDSTSAEVQATFDDLVDDLDAGEDRVGLADRPTRDEIGAVVGGLTLTSPTLTPVVRAGILAALLDLEGVSIDEGAVTASGARGTRVGTTDRQWSVIVDPTDGYVVELSNAGTVDVLDRPRPAGSISDAAVAVRELLQSIDETGPVPPPDARRSSRTCSGPEEAGQDPDRWQGWACWESDDLADLPRR